MHHLLKLLAATSLTATLALPTTTLAADKAAPANFTRGDIETIIQEYLLNNPKTVIDALNKYQIEQAKEAEEKAKQALVDNKDALYFDKSSPSVGKGDITVVEFFDYHCGYCKRMLPTIAKLLKERDDVRVVFKEFPILSEDSEKASKAALAVHSIAPEKYLDYHTALMNIKGSYSDEVLTAEASKLAIDEKKFKAAMESKAIQQQLDATKELGNKIGVRGTPAVIVGDTLTPGALPYDRLVAMVDAVKNAKPEKK